MGSIACVLSQTHLLISKISHICQEIHDIKRRQKPTSIGKTSNNTIMDKGQTNLDCTQEQDNNSSAKEGSGDVDGWDETYSSHSRLCHHEPNNPCIPSHHAPSLPFPNPGPSENSPEPPGDRSPSPASKIETETPSSPKKLERKACSAALSSSVHTSPSGPCAAWNVLLLTQNGLGEELSEESVMEEESLLVTGERGGGPGVGGLHPE